jgi:hypothetical protein
MKRKVLFVASLFLATATFAQDGLTSKKGEAYLPEAGDWSIGFNGTDLVNYVGNMANGSTGNTLNSGDWMNGSVGQEIRLKMFKDETTAYRLRARIGFASTSSDFLGTYDSDTTNVPSAPEDYTISTKTSSGFNLVLGAGLEKRRGNTRIQGYYGGEVFLGLLGGGTTTTDDGRIRNDNSSYDIRSATRTLEEKNGNTFTFGLQGFIGVEWFFAPKVSLGAEYTWGLSMNSTGEGETTTSTWGTAIGSAVGTANSEQELVTKTGSNGGLTFDTGHVAALNIHFHF